MTLHQLSYIIALDNFRHFSTAAEHCFVTQPTLSMQINKLEEELGVLIFDRTKQPVIPTDIGKKIIDQARIIVQEADRLQNIIDNETGDYTGSLKIGVIPTIAPYLIPLFIQSFITKYPNIEIIIDEIHTDEIVKGIHKNLIDVGILALPVDNSDMNEIPLFYEPFVGYISKKHPLHKKEKLCIDDLTQKDLLLLKEGHCLRDQTLKICKSHQRTWEEDDKKILFESGNLDTLQKLVEQNIGFTLLPYLAVKDLENKTKLSLVREFVSPIPKREVGLIHSKSFSKKHLIDVLAEEILKVVPNNLQEKENSFIVH